MIVPEQSPPHSHIRQFFIRPFFSALWHIFYEDVYEKYFLLPRLKKQQVTAERELNLLKVRKNDPYVNRGRFRVLINKEYKTNENRHNTRRIPTVD